MKLEFTETIEIYINPFGEFNKILKVKEGHLEAEVNIDLKVLNLNIWEQQDVLNLEIDILNVKYKGKEIDTYCEETLLQSLENCLSWR